MYFFVISKGRTKYNYSMKGLDGLKKLLSANKCLIAIFFIMIIVSFYFSGIVAYSVSNYNGITIVIDAGHGGRDGGSVGINGTIEKEINLKYALTLKEKLVDSGYRVELTRRTDDGLYSETALNKKMSDMRARFNIIQKTNPNLVISIHMNSFNSPTARGAITYYRNGDEASKRCADLVQASLNTYCEAPSAQGKVGDYYILNCSYYTSILIECGFISNPEEERLLNTDSYREKFIDAVYSGILLYFGNSNNSV